MTRMRMDQHRFQFLNQIPYCLHQVNHLRPQNIFLRFMVGSILLPHTHFSHIFYNLKTITIIQRHTSTTKLICGKET